MVRADAGQRAALNISIDGDEPERGHDLVETGRFFRSERLTIRFDLLRSWERTVRSGTRVIAMLGTRVENASLRFINKKVLDPGEHALAQLVFRAPVIATGAQRVLIRAGSPETTIGGGVVRSVFAPRLVSADTDWHERLGALQGATSLERLETAAWALGEKSWDGAMVHQEAGVWSEQTPGVDFASGRIDEGRLESLAERVFLCIEALCEGGTVERSRVVSAISGRTPADVLAAMDHLVARDRLVEHKGGVAMPANDDQISAEDRAAIDAIRRIYESYGVAPLPADDIASGLGVRRTEARRLVKIAAERSVLVHVSGPFFVVASAAANIRSEVVALLKQRGSVTVGDVRELLGITRKHAVPICEYLDRARVTRRVENTRVLFDDRSETGAMRDE